MSSDKKRLTDLAPTPSELGKLAEAGAASAVCRSHDGKFYVLWRGRPVFDNRRIKKFETEQYAQDFLDLSLALGMPANEGE